MQRNRHREARGQDDERRPPADALEQQSGQWEEDARGEAGHDRDDQQSLVAPAGFGCGDDHGEGRLIEAGRRGESNEDEDDVQLPDGPDLRPRQDSRDAEQRVEDWRGKIDDWDKGANVLLRRSEVRASRARIDEERELAEMMAPARQLVCPLLVVVPDTEKGE